MIATSGIITEIGSIIQEAIVDTQERMMNGDLEEEDAITHALFEGIRTKFNSPRDFGDYGVAVRYFRGRGPKSPESLIGADVCIVLSIVDSDVRINKGVLIQSKRERPVGSFVKAVSNRYPKASTQFHTGKDFIDLKEQCMRMLNQTPDSFVLVFSPHSFVVTPASSIAGTLSSAKYPEFYSKHLDAFFKEFFMCFIGDPGVRSTKVETLEDLLEDYRHVLEFKILGSTRG